MSKNRLEAFSDGVFAVAITLLVLEIHVPGGENLWHDLKEEWPSFASFFVSFWVIGIIWVNHHGVLDHLARADRGVLYLNLLLLFTVVFIASRRGWPSRRRRGPRRVPPPTSSDADG